MNLRALGTTGLRISEIGFGAWGLGGDHGGAVSYGPTDDAVSIKALQVAFESGVNFFDTANVYGFGHSEKVIGEALKTVRDQVLIGTKGGMIDAEGSVNFSESSLRSSLESSLKNLQTGYVDLYQMHGLRFDGSVDIEGLVGVLEKFQHEGLIRAYGVAAQTPDDALKAIEEYGFRSVMVNFNLLDIRALDNGVFAAARKHEAGLIARTPLCFGFLTGLVDGRTELPESDHRTRWSHEQREAWKRGHDMYQKELVGALKEQSSSQLALRFCLSFPEISSAIPGMLSQEHVVENAVASELGPLPKEFLDQLLRLARENDFFVSRGQHWLGKD